MGQIDTFGAYVRSRMEGWGDVFALHRDCEYLGHQSVNLLQVLIDHKGMPGRCVGFKPLEVPLDALQVEQIVSEIAREQPGIACVLRAYYCGRGRRKIERWETANLMLAYTGHKVVSQRHYLTMHDVGFAQVRGALLGIALAA